MPNYTPNLNLKKPLQTENYNVDDQNGNMDIIDSVITSYLAEQATQQFLNVRGCRYNG